MPWPWAMMPTRLFVEGPSLGKHSNSLPRIEMEDSPCLFHHHLSILGYSQLDYASACGHWMAAELPTRKESLEIMEAGHRYSLEFEREGGETSFRASWLFATTMTQGRHGTYPENRGLRVPQRVSISWDPGGSTNAAEGRRVEWPPLLPLVVSTLPSEPHE